MSDSESSSFSEIPSSPLEAGARKRSARARKAPAIKAPAKKAPASKKTGAVAKSAKRTYKLADAAMEFMRGLPKVPKDHFSAKKHKFTPEMDRFFKGVTVKAKKGTRLHKLATKFKDAYRVKDVNPLVTFGFAVRRAVFESAMANPGKGYIGGIKIEEFKPKGDEWPDVSFTASKTSKLYKLANK